MTDAIAITRTVLIASAAVLALVDRNSVYPILFPQNAVPPCLVLNIVGNRDEQMLSGPGGYFEARVGVECLAETPSAAIELGTAVLSALGGIVKQTVGTATDVDITFAGIDYTDSSDDRSMCRRILHFTVRYKP